MVGIRTNLRAATLVESLVAMLLIMLSFSMGLILYVSVLNANRAPARWRAHQHLNQAFFDTKKQNRFFDELIQSEQLTVQKRVAPYVHLKIESFKQLHTVELSAFDKQGKQAGNFRRLHIIE